MANCKVSKDRFFRHFTQNNKIDIGHGFPLLNTGSAFLALKLGLGLVLGLGIVLGLTFRVRV